MNRQVVRVGRAENDNSAVFERTCTLVQVSSTPGVMMGNGEEGCPEGGGSWTIDQGQAHAGWFGRGRGDFLELP